MKNQNPFEFKFSADESGAVQRPVFDFLIKTLVPSLLACLLIVLVVNVLLQMIPVSQHVTSLFLFAIVVFIPFFQAGRCLRLPGRSVPSVPRAFAFGIGAVAAFVGAVVARSTLFQPPESWEWPWIRNSLMALSISVLLMLLRRIVFGRRKMFPLMVAILPTSVISLTVLLNTGWLLHQKFPVQVNRYGFVVYIIVHCLYAHIVCAAWWLSDKAD